MSRRDEPGTQLEPARSSWSSSLPDLGGVGFDPARVEEAVRVGYEAGFIAGQADGHAAAFAAAREEAAVALELDRRQAGAVLLALRDELHRLTQVETDLRHEFEGAAVDAAVSLAEAIIGRELAVAVDPGRDAIIRALAVAPVGPAGVVVRMHPTDCSRLGDLADLALGRDVIVVTDTSLAPGDCVATIGSTDVDASVGAAVARAREALGGVS